MAITKEQVVNAYFELETQGKPTSLRAIRNHLGKGSLTTISNHLKSLGSTSKHEDVTLELLLTEISGMKKEINFLKVKMMGMMMEESKKPDKPDINW